MPDILSFGFVNWFRHYHFYEIPGLLVNFPVINLPCTFQRWKNISNLYPRTCFRRTTGIPDSSI